MAMNGPPAGPFEPIFRWDGDRPSRRVSISYVGPCIHFSSVFLPTFWSRSGCANSIYLYIFPSLVVAPCPGLCLLTALLVRITLGGAAPLRTV